MQNNNNAPPLVAIVAALLFSGCASTGAPSGWLTMPEDIPSDPYGGWVTVEHGDGLSRGELIAVSGDTLFLADSRLHAIPIAGIRSARLATYDPTAGQIALGTFGGVLLTLTNGAGLILTGPLWIIGGSIAAVSRSMEPIIDYPDEPIERFTAYARFPQGLSNSIRRETLRARYEK
jgi:hypothetical protein